MKETQRRQERDADLVGAALKQRGRTLAVAESLTGGLLTSACARASGPVIGTAAASSPMPARSSTTCSASPAVLWSAEGGGRGDGRGSRAHARGGHRHGGHGSRWPR